MSRGRRLLKPVVHRFLVYGHTNPAKVFEPDAAAGVGKLERTLHGVRAKTEVSAIDPPQTAAQLLTSDAKLAHAYGPRLAKRLQALEASLR